MLRSVLHTHRTYAYHENYVEWIKEATERVEHAMAEHNVKPWVTIQRTRVWKWASKMAQSSGPRWTHMVNAWHPMDIRVRGRPKTRWEDTINKYLTEISGEPHTGDDWGIVAADGERWTTLADGFIMAANLD